ncbi:MAG TPA: hypothetical protein VK395_34450 [Gemmataceae bacterium]|nr:hypothetical protein [Gemmataceae bacterium]
MIEKTVGVRAFHNNLRFDVRPETIFKDRSAKNRHRPVACLRSAMLGQRLEKGIGRVGGLELNPSRLAHDSSHECATAEYKAAILQNSLDRFWTFATFDSP